MLLFFSLFIVNFIIFISCSCVLTSYHSRIHTTSKLLCSQQFCFTHPLQRVEALWSLSLSQRSWGLSWFRFQEYFSLSPASNIWCWKGHDSPRIQHKGYMAKYEKIFKCEKLWMSNKQNFRAVLSGSNFKYSNIQNVYVLEVLHTLTNGIYILYFKLFIHLELLKVNCRCLLV